MLRKVQPNEFTYASVINACSSPNAGSRNHFVQHPHHVLAAEIGAYLVYRPNEGRKALTEIVWLGSGAADSDWEAASCILEEMGTAAINPGLVSSLTRKAVEGCVTSTCTIAIASCLPLVLTELQLSGDEMCGGWWVTGFAMFPACMGRPFERKKALIFAPELFRHIMCSIPNTSYKRCISISIYIYIG